MRRRVFIFVRGILGCPGDSKEWNAKACPWIHNNTDDRAENFETLVGPIDRAFGQWRRAKNLARLLREYEGWDIVVVAHSNGADVALKGLLLARWPRIQALHLLSAACEANFRINGLNQALFGKRIGRVCLYRAGKDQALRLAALWPARWLGYGLLGRKGPLNVLKSVEHRVGEIVRPDFGHSSWFLPGEFERTMEHFPKIIGGHGLWTA